MSFADSAEQRIVDLELRYMGLERAFDELSQVVAAQQQVIDALTLEAKRRCEGRDDDTHTPVRDEPPPHY